MTERFPTHTAESAPQAAEAPIRQATEAFGFLPNLIGTMSTSPALAEAYLALWDIFQRKTDLTDAEQHVVVLTVSRFHECHYCMAAHSTTAGMAGVDRDVVDALREDRSINDPQLEALRRVTHEMVVERGWPSSEALASFYEAGFEPRHLLDVVVGVGHKVLSNYTNHLTDTPVDKPMQANAWQTPA
ncbi:carboxymuconolactone decarboxylase family protein [Guyparkeria sp. 1SP6A2]|nr:carboxymuconolactone decarboxylase family protein [Guyparkeria sp. 1SP6A2]